MLCELYLLGKYVRRTINYQVQLQPRVQTALLSGSSGITLLSSLFSPHVLIPTFPHRLTPTVTDKA